MNSFVYCDFEFGRTQQRYLKLVCASFVWEDGSLRTYNLLAKGEQERLKLDIQNRVTPSTILVSYAIDAEVRALMSLYRTSWLAELPFKRFICLRREHLMLANRCPHTTYGEVLTKAGTVKKRRRMGGYKEPSDTKDYLNLLNALFKFCGIHDTEHAKQKDYCRDICIRAEDTELQLHLDQIMRYCGMDTEHLPMLHKRMWDEYAGRLGQRKMEVTEREFTEQLFRGWYGALIAQKVNHGYSVDFAGLINLCNNKGVLISEFCENFNRTFPDNKAFVWDAKELRYKFRQETVRAWMRTHLHPAVLSKIPRTKKERKLSISKDVLEPMYDTIKDSIPENDYLGQVYKYLRMASALRGIDMRPRPFNSKRARTFGDYVDTVERVVRPHYNDFGSQTSRNQPSANGYLLAKPAWMRSLITAPEGQWLVSADFNKQEPLALGVVSEDEVLIGDYSTGDLYVAFGKGAGILRDGLTKSEFDIKRQICKQVFLAMTYRMTAKGLAEKLSQVMGRSVGEAEAQSYINKYNSRYKKAVRWMGRQVALYAKQKGLRLPDGWWMWFGNTNERSIKNFGIQGICAVAMRMFEWFAFQRGIHVTFTLHDGFYFYCPSAAGGLPDYGFVREVLDCMHRGFVGALGNKPGADLVGVELSMVARHAMEVPSEKLKKDLTVDGRRYTIDKYATVYLDPRAENDLRKYSRLIWPEFNF